MKQTFLKQNKLLRALLVALVAVVTFSLSACDGTNLDYSDFKDDHLDSWEYVTTRPESQYLVYFYGENCSYCKTIKADVLPFAQTNNAGVKMYFVDSAEADDYDDFKVTDPTTGEEIPGTPTMIVINDGNVMSVNVGPSVIRDLLEKIQEGSYAFIE